MPGHKTHERVGLLCTPLLFPLTQWLHLSIDQSIFLVLPILWQIILLPLILILILCRIIGGDYFVFFGGRINDIYHIDHGYHIVVLLAVHCGFCIYYCRLS